MKKMFIIMFLVFLASCEGGNDDVFSYEYGGIYWSEISNDGMIWDEAVKYCENLGGRLPTISELRTLIQNCPATETGGECGVTDDCRSHDGCLNSEAWICDGCTWDTSGKYSVFGDTGLFFSSTEETFRDDVVWSIYFEFGGVMSCYKSAGPLVRCVKDKL